MSIIKIEGNKNEIINELTDLANEFVNSADKDIGYTAVIQPNSNDMPRPMVLANEIRDRVLNICEKYKNGNNINRMDVWCIMTTYDLATDMITFSYNTVNTISQIIIILDNIREN